VVGFHGYDLYHERTSVGFFPFRPEQIRNADVVAPCSLHGASYLSHYYPFVSDKLIVKRIGVKDFGLNNFSQDGILRILSCSFVSPVKRLEMIVKSLEFVTVDVEWTHIGGGDGLEALRTLAATKLAKHIRYRFLGSLPSFQVHRYYNDNTVDLFINLSSSEGVPVSIMEALSAGVPVLATNVGGVSELVDDKCGYLVPADIKPVDVSKVIEQHTRLTMSQVKKIRDNARIRAVSRCRTPNVQSQFFDLVYNKT
jgi:glycosyltransferase involved in cell wall biosynthesis